MSNTTPHSDDHTDQNAEHISHFGTNNSMKLETFKKEKKGDVKKRFKNNFWQKPRMRQYWKEHGVLVREEEERKVFYCINIVI
jgi:hypothetical protein